MISKSASAPVVDRESNEKLDMKPVQLLSKAEYQSMTEEEKEAHREKSKWAGYVAPEKKRPPDEYFDLNTLAQDAIRCDAISLTGEIKPVTYKDFINGVVDKDAILKFVLVEGKGTLI